MAKNKPASVLLKSGLISGRIKIPATRVSPLVVESAAMDVAGVYARLNSRSQGLKPPRKPRCVRRNTVRTCWPRTSVPLMCIGCAALTLLGPSLLKLLGIP